jgi:F-type H+-transporting ATPase subunit b
LSKATDEAKAERSGSSTKRGKAADALSAKRQESLANDAQNLNQAITPPDAAGSVCHRAKGADDLATTSLEERMGEVFTRRLRDGRRGESRLAEALKTRPNRARAQRLRPAGRATRGDPKCAQRNLLG